MSFPAEDLTALYRNPIWQVQRALDRRHGDRYKVYNLCIECAYDSSAFHGRVEEYPFDDMHVPPLPLIKLFCESVHDWLGSNPENVAVIHCKAGKGRTGLMVCAYLLYTGKASDAEEALQLYASKRTYNNRGVTIASQQRYVKYWSQILVFPNNERGNGGVPEVRLPSQKPRELRRIRMYDTLVDIVKFSVKEIREVPGKLYSPSVEVASGYCNSHRNGFFTRTVSPRYFNSWLPREGDEKVKADKRFVSQMDTERPNKYLEHHFFEKTLCVSGDVRIIFYNKSSKRLFYICFNTYFISGSVLQFKRGDLDKVGRSANSIFGTNFCIEFLFGPNNTAIP